MSSNNIVRGSKKYIQLVINKKPSIIQNNLKFNDQIKWVSPLKKDNYKEYWDSRFLKELGLDKLQYKLGEFWPRGGAHWDALGKSKEAVFIVEAKAHITEQMSGPSKAKAEKSIKLISKSLNEVKQFLGVEKTVNWMKSTYYQYANRLAHLYFLREWNKIDAHLLFIYFLNDDTVDPVKSEKEWRRAIEQVHAELGLSKKFELKQYVHELFIDVNDLK